MTITPPTSVAVAGCSDTASHTHSGPSTTSSSVIVAISAAGIRRAPIESRARPSPICPAPSRIRRTRLRPSTEPGWANPTAQARIRIWARAVAGAMFMCRWWRVITMLTANEIGITIVSSVTRIPPCPGAPTMTPTPASAMTIAIPERRDTGSPSISHASSAAIIGAAAWRKRTFATVL
jgi:hypothetical protein